MINFLPLPAQDRKHKYQTTVTEQELIDWTRDTGYVYFVQYNTSDEDINVNNEALRRCRREYRQEMKEFLVLNDLEPGRDWFWIGGRGEYEFCFKEEAHAAMFKMAFGI